MDGVPKEVMIRISALERKVSDLYERVGQAEPDLDALATEDIPDGVVELVQQGDMAKAILLYRESTARGLAESKDAVDRIAKQYGPPG